MKGPTTATLFCFAYVLASDTVHQNVMHRQGTMIFNRYDRELYVPKQVFTYLEYGMTICLRIAYTLKSGFRKIIEKIEFQLKKKFVTLQVRHTDIL